MSNYWEGGHAPLPLPMPMQGQITDSFDQIASGISLTEVYRFFYKFLYS